MIQTNECVIYQKQTDTHAIVSATVPIDGRYKIKLFDGRWIEKDLEAGQVIHSLQALVRNTCPGYEAIQAEFEG